MTQSMVVEGVRIDENEQCVIVSVRPDARRRGRCGQCRRPAAGYDAGRGRRRWRCLDHGAVRVFLEADMPRVRCRSHGVVTAAVPWARHDAGHTLAFDQQCAWMAAECSKSAAAQLMRTSWRTVGGIVARVVADRDAASDRLAGLTRIGIDEISYRKGQKYMTVVVDHESGKVVWMADGHGKGVLAGFFDALGAERAARLTHISADGALWIAEALTERAPGAVRVMDPFHVVAWATDALDTERRASWNRARRQAQGAEGREQARALKDSRFALWKNADDLTDRQAAKLTWIAATDPRLHRAYLLKEALRAVFALAKTRPTAALQALDRWIGWACRCRIDAFVDLQRRIRRHYQAIRAALTTGMSNGLIESTNTKTRLIIRRGFGFHSADAIIALVMLTLAGNKPTLPGRQPATE
nr:ISL3 family transposase [Streptomyces sp. NBC_00830]WTB28648.1 ISL3 family transposase [Streptomyces sp. NBC_00830]WTB29694.1 ISL3 family transposase [Streptomyces sp. NBC_00830]WTB29972.1 ISL3 family transposase [Streptomyces sp. NBC_00830]WTB31425.1 ISL3 family transposase [Streptomyces sp. NBC_00830]